MNEAMKAIYLLDGMICLEMANLFLWISMYAWGLWLM